MEAVLKRQAFESFRWKLDEWWIVLCFDLTVAARVKLVKRINSELLQQSPVPIRIYEPTKAWSMLSMDEDEVDALCVLFLCKEDEILIEARSEVSELSGRAFNVVMATIFDSFEDHASEYSLDEMEGLISEDNTYDIDVTSEVIDELSGYLSRVDYDDAWRVNPHYYQGLCALYFEGKVRYQLSHAGAANFVRKLMSAS